MSDRALTWTWIIHLTMVVVAFWNFPLFDHRAATPLWVSLGPNVTGLFAVALTAGPMWSRPLPPATVRLAAIGWFLLIPWLLALTEHALPPGLDALILLTAVMLLLTLIACLTQAVRHRMLVRRQDSASSS